MFVREKWANIFFVGTIGKERGRLLMASDPNLESQVRQTAERQIGQAALDDGILDKAWGNAKASVSSLLYGLGFKAVVVE